MSLRVTVAQHTVAVTAVLAAVTTAVLGCGAREAPAGESRVAARVAAVWGMGSLVPAADAVGSASSAQDLVFVSLDRYASVVLREPAALVLETLPRSSLSTEQLADAIRFDGVADISVESPSRIRVAFEHEAARSAFERVRQVVDDGPFRIGDRVGGVHRLLKRRPGRLDVIEIHEVTTEEQWRRLLGRRLDVIPVVEERNRIHLRGVSSVRAVDIDTDGVVALYFNAGDAPLVDVRLRRYIARALDREAISRVVCRSDRCDLSPPAAPDPGDLALPTTLVLAVPNDHDEGILAAETIRHQLREHGVELEIRPTDPAGILDLFDSGECDMFLAPWSRSDSSYSWFLSPRAGRPPITGYANPDYDKAVLEKDLPRAQAILDRDVPVTPLYKVSLFAVVDNRLCGDVEPSATSWLWIADLRPCEPGEVP